MKIISPDVELIRQEPGLEGIFKQIERAGRTCYKSEDKINENSARVFVERMIESKHYSMLEHGTVYLTLPISNKFRDKLVHYPWYMSDSKVQYNEIYNYIQYLFMKNKYSVVKLSQNKDYTETTMCITTNYRVIVENGWEGIMHEFLSEPTIYHERRISLKFITNIGVTRESNRHRVNSIAEESTRYCNYTKDKFGNKISICKPAWFIDEDIENINKFDESEWMDYMLSKFDTKNPDFLNFNSLDWYAMSITFAQIAYRNLIRLDWKPQQAREVLPLATKSEVVYTAFEHDWKHWFDLRLLGTTGKPHPNMEQVAELAQKVLIDNDLWNLIYNPDDKNP